MMIGPKDAIDWILILPPKPFPSTNEPNGKVAIVHVPRLDLWYRTQTVLPPPRLRSIGFRKKILHIKEN